jgi:hypothetical protein
VTSGLPYKNALTGRTSFAEGLKRREFRMAMSIGGESLFSSVQMSHWQVLAANLDVEFDFVASKIREMSGKLPDLASAAAKAESDLVDRATLKLFVDEVTANVKMLTPRSNKRR